MKKKLPINLVSILRKKTLYLTAFLFMIAQIAAVAQNINVKGNVKSNDGSTLPGVSIFVKGTTNGTTSAADGTFTISAPSSGTLVFSFIGFESVEVPVSGRTQLGVTLKNQPLT